MKKPSRRTVLAICLLCASAVMIFAGLSRKYPVHQLGAAELAEALDIPLMYEEITEVALIGDSLFGGTSRRDGRLWSTYDRSKKAGRRACPT